MDPSVAIIIVNWNGLSYTSKCIESLAGLTYSNYKIIVVDNASDKSNVESLRQNRSIDKLILNTENEGFTGGNNRGIIYALKEGFDYVLLLNNDTEVTTDFLSKLVEISKNEATTGAVQPKIKQLPEQSKIWNAGGQLNKVTGKTRTLGFGQLDKGQFDAVSNVDWLTGCCMLISTHVVDKVGMLDEKFFAYHEDVDWSFRIRKAGYQLKYVPNSVIYHHAGKASTNDQARKGQRLSPFVYYLNFRNRIFVIRKHASWKWIKMMSVGAEALIYLIFFLIKRRFSKFRAILEGIKEGCFYPISS